MTWITKVIAQKRKYGATTIPVMILRRSGAKPGDYIVWVERKGRPDSYIVYFRKRRDIEAESA